MGLKKIFCPNCGNETQVDDSRAFCFCLECGQKIQLGQSKTEKLCGDMSQPMVAANQQDVGFSKRKNLEEKLKEVEFYYSLSYEKKEAERSDSEPIYYLKAQDLLIDLSREYPEDYRVWLELSKPLDYSFSDSGLDIENRYSINEDYFNKALDLAELSIKRQLIDAHDEYIQNKQEAYKRTQEIRASRERERQQRLLEEERRRQEELEEKRKKEEEEELLALAEQMEAERREKEELEQKIKKQEIEKQKYIDYISAFCEALVNKDYSCLDGKYFELRDENNQNIIGIFKQASNLLYLMSFRIQPNKANVIYRDQSISVLFDRLGHVLKYDRRPLKIKGFIAPNDAMKLEYDNLGRLCVNGIELKEDDTYIKDIIKRSKKPMLAFNKTFL